MRQHAARTVAAVLLALVLGACARLSPTAAGPTPSAAPGPPLASSGGTAPRCRAAALALRPGPGIVPMTGEHGAFYALVNHGQTACTLTGYPGIALYDARGALPFRYTHHSQYVTRAGPRTVLLPPGASAYVLVAKYRCDLGVISDAAAIRLSLPGPGGAVLTSRVSGSRAGAAALSYCQGGPGSPGQAISVSPIEPAPAAAGPFPASRDSGQSRRSPVRGPLTGR
jgi:Domain of unknown function (DUF4232)